MNDQELLSRFIKVETRPKDTQISVCLITWSGPHTPESHWQVVTVLPPDTDTQSIAKASGKILHDKRFFRVCEECQQRNPDGWMHGESICQGCASKKYGIVY